MTKIIFIIIGLLILIFLLVLLGFTIRSISVNRDARQKEFLAGTVPSPLPDGFYAGKVNGYRGSWTGKTFDVATGLGINNFKDGNKLYPFRFYAGQGLSDKIPLLKIDYNQPQNSWWVRHVVDEVVQTAPGHFLGKIHTKFIGLTFTVGYFTLLK